MPVVARQRANERTLCVCRTRRWIRPPRASGDPRRGPPLGLAEVRRFTSKTVEATEGMSLHVVLTYRRGFRRRTPMVAARQPRDTSLARTASNINDRPPYSSPLALSRSSFTDACVRVEWRPMGRLLKKVIEETAKLSESEQEAFAAFMLAELESERRWDELFARSQDVLARMAEEARREYRAGRTEPLDLDKL